MIDINQELKQNFLDFSYEANSQRAFADARDGLKPGQRACLWEMYNKKYSSSKPHVKSAKISGGVVANWWPHGTTAIYETFARMSQSWINNLPEVDWHGGNGSVQISNEPAADRYTEARLAKSTEEGLLFNINKHNVPMKLNFTEDEEWPEVFPAIYPRLMVNGCQGIGSTIANTWLPTNLNELSEVINNYLASGELNYDNLYPDFPSGGIIINKKDIPTIYATGKGRVILRGKADIQKKIIQITEIPYQVYVEPLIDQIKKLVAEDTITDIVSIENKSDKKRLLIEIECANDPARVLQQLYNCSDLQKTYNANQIALIGKTPKMLNLQQYLDVFIEHNLTCIVNEYNYDLTKAKDRIEIVDGLLKALEDIDNIIQLIKSSESAAAAAQNLCSKYNLSERQSKAIVDMKLGRLAKLEKIELETEKTELIDKITNCELMINNESKQKELFLNRLNSFVKKYGFARRTELTQINIAKTKEEKEIAAIPPQKCVVVLTESGNIKRIASTSFRAQNRAGKGVKTQDDITSMVLRTNTVDSLIVFTDQGNMYRLIVDDIPEGTNTSKGTPVRALISMNPGESPQVIYSIYRETDAKYIVFVTKQGNVKRTSLDEYVGIKRKTGTKAINLREGDKLATMFLATDEDIIILTKNGYAIRCKGSQFPASGRVTTGVKGINLHNDDEVITALPIRDASDDLAVFSNIGMARRIPLTNFLYQTRNGRGVVYAKDANTAAATLVAANDKILICGDKTSICLKASDIPETASKISVGNIVIKGNTRITGVSKI